MLTLKQQKTLTEVSKGTPMGELLRYYWMPIAVSSSLEQSKTKKIKILGENLVLFRDTKGNLGLTAEQCPHRLTSLSYGIVDEEGIRCPYHGWKFNSQGKCLETPPEADNKKLCEKINITAYPVQELGGLIFAYLGKSPSPLLPNYDLYVLDGVIRDIGYTIIPCNWLQIMENSVDPYHLQWLHGHHLAHIRSQNGQPSPTHYLKKQVKIGFDLFEYGIIKRRVLKGGSEEDDDWKIGHPLIFPNMLRVGSHPQHRFQIRVPIDDTNTLHFWYSCYHPRTGVEIPKQQVIPSYEVIWQDDKGDFLLDFVDGQDIMSWVTQGKICDRTKENLATSDKGIILYRRVLFEQLEIIKQGKDPMGVIRDINKNKIIEFPQEKNKFGAGKSFLAESIAMSHVRYSPLKDLLPQIL